MGRVAGGPWGCGPLEYEGLAIQKDGGAHRSASQQVFDCEPGRLLGVLAPRLDGCKCAVQEDVLLAIAAKPLALQTFAISVGSDEHSRKLWQGIDERVADIGPHDGLESAYATPSGRLWRQSGSV